MAAISDSSSIVDGFDRRRSRNLPSPWSNVVRGGESEAVPATTPGFAAASSPTSATNPFPLESDHEKLDSPPSETSVDYGDNAVARAKKPAWNKPSNGAVEIGPVMGASWPALSESAKASPKSSSDSLKALVDGSSSASDSQAITPSSPHKQNNNNNNNNTNPNSTSSHVFLPARQKSMKRGGGTANNGGLQPPPSIEITTQNASEKPTAAAATATVGMDSSPRDGSQKNGNWETTSRGTVGSQQPHAGNDQQQPRNSFRRGNGGGGGAHPRRGGDGPYHSNYGSRRDQDRPNYEWNPHQNFSGRDIHMRQQRGAPRGFIRQPPPTPPPFINPLPVRPYASPIGFPDSRSSLYYVPAPPPESLSAVVPYVAHAAPPGMFISAPDPQLRAMLVKQIDYYFSSENLCKDIFLRKNMDEQGWVPVSLIANFNRVKQLTVYIPFILEAMRASTVVEVQGDKIRKRNDWVTWLLPRPNLSSSVMSGPQSPNYDSLATQMQNIGLERTAAYNTTQGLVDSHAEGVLTRSLSGEPNSQLQGTIRIGISNGEEMGHTVIQMGSDQSMSVRRLEKSGSC